MKSRKYIILIALIPVMLFSASCGKDDNSSPQQSNGKAYSRQATGKSAHDLLSADKYKSLLVEILYMKNAKPVTSALDQLKTFLENRLHKPAGIKIILREIPSAGKSKLSLSDIRTIENTYRENYTADGNITVCILYTDTDYTDNNVLGIAYQNTSICLFGKTIADHSGGIGEANTAKLTATVLEHEAGHLLGLVNIGSAMQTAHADKAHPDHCNNENCLMYYASETTDVLGFLIAGAVPQLDANCLADLKANGGK